jgi:hypothetical protein
LNHQWWSDSDHPVVSFLTKDFFFFQRFAVGTRWAVQFNPDP